MDTERRLIAVCAAWEDEENLNLFLSHLISETRDSEYLPVCITFDRNIVLARDMEGLREYMALFDMKNLAGVILFGEMIRSDTINRHLINMACQKQIPVFMLERTYENCLNVCYGYRTGFEQIVRHMVYGHQCRRVVMVAGFRGNVYSEERIEVCREVLREAGGDLPADHVIYGDFWDTPTIVALKQYFAAGGEMPDAFICANDAMAIAVCQYLNEQGVSVPEQVRVSGFDGILMGERHMLPITTAIPDYHVFLTEMIERIEHWDPEDAGKTENWSLPYVMDIRRSCGCETGTVHHISRVIEAMTRENLDCARHIREMGRFIRSTLTLDSNEELIRRLPQAFRLWTDAYYCVSLLDEQDKEIAETILHGENGTYTSGERFNWKGEPLPDFEKVIRNRDICILLAHLLQTTEETMGFMICGEKSWGIREEQRFEEQAIFMSSVMSAVFNNRRLNQANTAIRHLAEHDFLTGLNNRRGFLEELNEQLTLPKWQDRYLVLFSVDMDGLKKINDVYGHIEGDRALCALAGALRTEASGNGICARYGGDEFALALFLQQVPESVEPFRSRIEANAKERSGVRPYPISASMGKCVRPVREHPSIEAMLEESDRALYEDKLRRKTNRE